MVIDCGRCELRGTGCHDCVVTALEPRNMAGCSGEASGYHGEAPSHLGEAELRALAVLADAGMVPPLRLSLAGPRILPGAQTWTRRVLPATKAS